VSPVMVGMDGAIKARTGQQKLFWSGIFGSIDRCAEVLSVDVPRALGKVRHTTCLHVIRVAPALHEAMSLEKS
jgi:hypothetical protein